MERSDIEMNVYGGAVSSGPISEGRPVQGSGRCNVDDRSVKNAIS